MSCICIGDTQTELPVSVILHGILGLGAIYITFSIMLQSMRASLLAPVSSDVILVHMHRQTFDHIYCTQI